MIPLLRLAFFVTLLVHWAATAWAAASFQGLGDLPGGNYESLARGVSADGSVVVGYSYVQDVTPGTGGSSVGNPHFGMEGFVWDAEGGMRGIGEIPGGSYGSDAHAVSADGGTVVGWSEWGNSVPEWGHEAFEYDVQTGVMTGLGDVAYGDGRSSFARAVSGDGSVVVGTADHDFGFYRAFVWREGQSMAALPWQDSCLGCLTKAYDVTPDGSTIVGYQETEPAGGYYQAVVYDDTLGLQGLGFADGGSWSIATAISADSSVVVGTGDTTGAFGSFIYDEINGMRMIRDGSGQVVHAARAADVSGNGRVVVGTTGGSLAYTAALAYLTHLDGVAFVWDETNGYRTLESALASAGVDTTGWTLTTAQAISDDGTTIVGGGYNPSGQFEAFVATLPEPMPVPLSGPAMLLGLGLGLIGAGWRGAKLRSR
jgi:probable HAF family extracellular repeat protein